MKKLLLSTLMTFAIGVTAVGQSADKPFVGKWGGSNEAVQLNLYSPTPNQYTGEKTYGSIEGVYLEGRRIDEHDIIEVVEINGNTAVVKYLCSFDPEEKLHTATLTYNPSTGALTIINESGVAMCYQPDKLNLRKKGAAKRSTSGKKTTGRKSSRR